MIQSTYVSDSKYGNKWYPMDDAPVPLLRTNYLSEFRTEMEKAKARKNLGIPDEMQMKWGGMSGYVEEQRDLVEYMELKWKYTTPLSEDISTVAEALDYIMILITTYTNQKEELNEFREIMSNLEKDIEDTKTLINTEHEALQKEIDENIENIQKIELTIITINLAITKLNNDLININVDTNILNWINGHLSDTITLSEDDNLEVIISNADKNALLNDNGLYVKDNSAEIEANAKSIKDIQKDQSTINETLTALLKTIDDVKRDVEGLNIQASGYNTTLADNVAAPVTVGGIAAGTTVGDLKGKTLIDIVDIMLFPTTVRDLVYPRLSYSPSSSLIEVGTAFSKPLLIFTLNDAGDEISREETLTLNGTVVEMTAYDQLGTYRYSAKVTYAAGEYLTDSKGNITDKRIEAGSLTASSTYITTYPWYAGKVGSVNKQALVLFGSSSGDKTITMGGNAVIKLPGTNSTINNFTVDGGLGYTAVNMSGWTESTEQLNGITYKVWTKSVAYTSDFSHKINFTLAL